MNNTEKIFKQLLKHIESNIAELVDTTPNAIQADLPFLMGRIYQLTDMKYYVVSALQASRLKEDDEESL